MSGPESAPPGWYPDANDPHRERWWDGGEWSDQTRSVATPPARRSTVRVLLLGCAGLVAFCIAAFVVLVVVRATQISSHEERSTREQPGSATESATLLSSRGYRGPRGCFALDPGKQWRLVEETGLGAHFSADPEHPLTSDPDPGQAGLWIETSCAPLDKVGSNWIPSLPGLTVVEKERVDFGGGRGTLYVLRYEHKLLPPALHIDYSVDRNGARCGLTVEGSPDAIARFRPEFERAAASFVCAGR